MKGSCGLIVFLYSTKKDVAIIHNTTQHNTTYHTITHTYTTTRTTSFIIIVLLDW